ncbi:hypothetical protein Tco_0421709 [Tanacetum coccineum]
MSGTTVANLRPTQRNCILEAKVYRKWISKSIPDIRDIAFCCILIDKETRQYLSMGDFGNGYSLKDKNEAKTDKTEHGNGKSMKRSDWTRKNEGLGLDGLEKKLDWMAWIDNRRHLNPPHTTSTPCALSFLYK